MLRFHEFTEKSRFLWTKNILPSGESCLGGKICFDKKEKQPIDKDRSGMSGQVQNRMSIFSKWLRVVLQTEVKESHDKFHVPESGIWNLTESFLNRLEELFLYIGVLQSEARLLPICFTKTFGKHFWYAKAPRSTCAITFSSSFSTWDDWLICITHLVTQ